ncbi:MAG: TIM barrel protein [Verrucomicrobiales bacterium]|nr:TIM barrel protein [Verrucomicrobiales bacterium]
MKLKVFKTLWGHTGSLDEAIAACHQHGFDGIEGQPPPSLAERREFRAKLDAAGLDYIAEICTAGSYVPHRNLSPFKHLESLQACAETALDCRPHFLTVIAGCDAWSVGESVDFFGAAIRIADGFGINASFETHRSRSFFNPWTTRDILRQLPALKLTCDFSHWCVVCERLIDTEPDVIALCAERAHHIHARVGYDQGPQVPHPAAPEFRAALEAHERWWTQIWQSQLARNMAVSTMTPEFGPDGYLHCAPFTGEPVADLAEINAWMAQRQKRKFDETFMAGAARTFVDRVSNPLALEGKNHYARTNR